jgi:hypothetical protein
MAGEIFDLYYRDPIECIKALFGDPEFSHDLLLEPERHFTGDDKKVRLYHEMHTGKWWWETQVCKFAFSDGVLSPMVSIEGS